MIVLNVDILLVCSAREWNRRVWYGTTQSEIDPSCAVGKWALSRFGLVKVMSLLQSHETLLVYFSKFWWRVAFCGILILKILFFINVIFTENFKNVHLVQISFLKLFKVPIMTAVKRSIKITQLYLAKYAPLRNKLDRPVTCASARNL